MRTSPLSAARAAAVIAELTAAAFISALAARPRCTALLLHEHTHAHKASEHRRLIRLVRFGACGNQRALCAEALCLRYADRPIVPLCRFLLCVQET